MSFIQDVPRTLVLNGISFSAQDVYDLKQMFPVLDYVTLPKRQIRESVLLQKCLLAEAIACNSVQTGTDSAALNLTQDGKLLIAKY